MSLTKQVILVASIYLYYFVLVIIIALSSDHWTMKFPAFVECAFILLYLDVIHNSTKYAEKNIQRFFFLYIHYKMYHPSLLVSKYQCILVV